MQIAGGYARSERPEDIAAPPGPAAHAERRSTPFIPYIHSFRAVAIVAVVISHVDFPFGRLTLGERLLLSVSRDASVLFLFIAGFLFQYLSTGFSYRRYLKSKLQNVILPYVIVSLPLLLHQYYRQFGPFAVASRRFENPFLQGAWALLTAAQMPAPMWFIPMIACLYLAAPFLLAMDRHPKFYWIAVPLLLNAMFCHRPMPVNHIGQALVYFAPAYVIGMWFSRYQQRCTAFVEANLVTLFSIWAAAEIFSVVVLNRSGPIFGAAYSFERGVLDLNLPDKLLLSVCLVGVLSRYQSVIGHRLDYLAGASFGVFFVHGYVLNAAERRVAKVWDHGAPLGISTAMVVVPICVLVSLGLVAAVRAVAGKRSRHIIGC